MCITLRLLAKSEGLYDSKFDFLRCSSKEVDQGIEDIKTLDNKKHQVNYGP